MNKPTQRFSSLVHRLDDQARANRRRQLSVHQGDGTGLIDAGGNRLINFGSNDYLGLVADSIATVSSETLGATASPLVCGWSPEHERLRDAICHLEQTESAVVFASGYAACSGTIATLAIDGDLILSDQLNHASLIDGCRLARSQTVVYPHRDVNFVDDHLRRYRGEYREVWLVTDSVFSMDGDVAPLIPLIEIASRYNAYLVVDEAHATGVLGDRGSGLCEAMGVADRVDVRIGTLSKAVGCQGGFAAGPKVVIDTLIQSCRSLIFSTALSPVIANAACGIVELLPRMADRRRRVAEHAKRLREGIAAHVKHDPIEQAIPIVPVITGSDLSALQASERLHYQGCWVPAIRPPTVPRDQSRLRISLSAAHDCEQISRLIDALSALPD
ncbi:MAG: 8-amino-7-oxononanoate synthase [Planctomycetota bacterium]